MITLVIFTCEGREHLLSKTIESFRRSCRFSFEKILLAIDGKINQEVIDQISPSLIVQSYKRKGYVSNIRNALNQVSTKYFFWLEDDWDFLIDVNIELLSDVLNEDKNVIQVVLSKGDKPSHAIDTKTSNISRGLYGFSANPCLCRSDLVKDAFFRMGNKSKTDESKVMGFENFMSEYMVQRGLHNLLFYNGAAPAVQHLGYIESTAREYHMIHSLHEGVTENETYISGFEHTRRANTFNKVTMLPKLWLSFAVLSFNLFSRREAYDFALRIYLSYLKKFKN